MHGIIDKVARFNSTMKPTLQKQIFPREALAMDNVTREKVGNGNELNHGPKKFSNKFPKFH